MRTKIYAIRENHWVKYIGKTSRSLAARLAGHLQEARDELSQTYKSRGIRKLLSQGILPRITLIAEVDGDGCKEEIAWIKYIFGSMILGCGI